MQGSADVFGRLSKVRSELKNMLWTHPAGTQAGIADALEYLNQVNEKDMTLHPRLNGSHHIIADPCWQCMCRPGSAKAYLCDQAGCCHAVAV